MYTTLKRVDAEDKWHLESPRKGGLLDKCIQSCFTYETIVIGEGSPRCQPDPPKDELCPICFPSVFKTN